jgi:hypothetical protein
MMYVVRRSRGEWLLMEKVKRKVLVKCPAASLSEREAADALLAKLRAQRERLKEWK